MKTNKHRVVFGATLLLASALLTAPAGAVYPTSSATESSMSVTFADLNLATDAGIDMLYKRLQRAAEVVCGPRNLRSAGSITALRASKDCYMSALDHAVARIGHPALDALHGA